MSQFKYLYTMHTFECKRMDYVRAVYEYSHSSLSIHWWGESHNVPIIFQSAQTNVQKHDVYNGGRCFLLYEETLKESWRDKS